MNRLEYIKNKLSELLNVVLQSAWQTSSTFPAFCEHVIYTFLSSWLQPLLCLATLTFYALSVVLPFSSLSYFLVLTGLLPTYFMDWFQNLFISNPGSSVMALSTLFFFIQLYRRDIDIISQFYSRIVSCWSRYDAFMANHFIFLGLTQPWLAYYLRVLFTFF